MSLKSKNKNLILKKLSQEITIKIIPKIENTNLIIIAITSQMNKEIVTETLKIVKMSIVMDSSKTIKNQDLILETLKMILIIFLKKKDKLS